jgi:hypothetical protein
MSDGTVRFWDARTGEESPEIRTGEEVWSVAFSPDGETLASSGGSGTIRLWDLETRQELDEFDAEGPCTLAFSPDGEALAAATREGQDPEREGDKIRLWSVASGEEFLKIDGPDRTGSGHVLCELGYSPDGRKLATTHAAHDHGESLQIRVWDAGLGKELLRITDLKDYVNAVVFLCDGKVLASGGRTGVIRLWDAESGRELASLRGHGCWIWSMAASPDGRMLASAGDNTVLVWDVAGAVAHAGQPKGAVGSESAAEEDSIRVIPEQEPAWRNRMPWALRQTVSFDFRNVPVAEALKSLEADTSVSLVFDERVAEVTVRSPVSLKVDDMLLSTTLGWLLRMVDLDYTERGDIVFVSTRDGVIEEFRRQVRAARARTRRRLWFRRGGVDPGGDPSDRENDGRQDGCRPGRGGRGAGARCRDPLQRQDGPDPQGRARASRPRLRAEGRRSLHLDARESSRRARPGLLAQQHRCQLHSTSLGRDVFLVTSVVPSWHAPYWTLRRAPRSLV